MNQLQPHTVCCRSVKKSGFCKMNQLYILNKGRHMMWWSFLIIKRACIPGHYVRYLKTKSQACKSGLYEGKKHGFCEMKKKTTGFCEMKKNNNWIFRNEKKSGFCEMKKNLDFAKWKNLEFVKWKKSGICEMNQLPETLLIACCQLR